MDLEKITPRQRETLGHVARGLLNKQIVHEMGTTESTIKAHVSALLTAFGVESRVQLVLKAQRLQLVPLPEVAA